MSFGKRPLFIFLFALICGFSLFISAPSPIPIALSLLTLCVAAVFLLVKNKKIRPFAAPLFAFSIGILLSLLYFRAIFPLKIDSETEVRITGIVTEVNEGQYGDTWVMKTESVNGKKQKALIEVKPSSLSADAKIIPNLGDRLTLSGKVSLNADHDGVSDPYGTSEGFAATFYPKTLEDAESFAKKPLSALIIPLRDRLTKRISDRFDKDSAALFSALLVGQKKDLSPDLVLAFRRTGTSHLLAISGMHLAVLFGLIDKLLSLFRLSKRPRKVLLILFTLFYMAFTGFPTSIVRAGLMLILSSVLFLIKSDHDTFTGLSISVFLILLFEPYAALDISLWLSAFATFGVVYAAEMLSSEEKASDSGLILLCRKIGAPIVISIFAIAATAIFSVKTFGEISWFGILATPVFGLFVEFYLILGILLLPIGAFFRVSRILGALTRVFTHIALKSSGIRHLLLPADTLISELLAFALLAVLLVAFFLNIKNLRLVTLLTVALLGCFFAVGFTETLIADSRDEAVYLSSGAEEGIFVCEKRTTFWIDETDEDGYAAKFVANAIRREHRTELDYAVFPNGNYEVCDEIEVLASKIKVRTVVIGKPKNKAETATLEKVQSAASIHGFSVEIWDRNTSLVLGSTTLSTSVRLTKGTRKYSVLGLEKDGALISYFPRGTIEIIEKAAAETIISASNSIVFGCHGFSEKYYHKIETDAPFLTLAVLSDGHISLSEENLAHCRTDYSKRCILIH